MRGEWQVDSIVCLLFTIAYSRVRTSIVFGESVSTRDGPETDRTWSIVAAKNEWTDQL